MAASQESKLSSLISQKNHAEQATYFLNAFWAELGTYQTKQTQDLRDLNYGSAGKNITMPEQIWLWVKIFENLSIKYRDSDKKISLDSAYDILTRTGVSMTIIKQQALLKEVDLNHDGHVSVLEFLLCLGKIYPSFQVQGITLSELLTRPQGTNRLLADAQTALNQVQQDINKTKEEVHQLRQRAKGTGVKALSAKKQAFSNGLTVPS